MPFITQGKTNWKHVLIIVVLAVMASIGILGWQRWIVKKEEKMPEVKFPEVGPGEKPIIPLELNLETTKLAVISDDYERTEEIVFSPDRKRVAYKAEIDGKWFVEVDGERGMAYDNVWDLVFSPDSKHFAYCAIKEGGSFVVLDGEKLKAYDEAWGPAFSPDNEHLVYVAIDGGNIFAVIDGVEQPPYYGISGFAFSPDSKHLAYVAIVEEVDPALILPGEPWAKKSCVILDKERHGCSGIIWDITFSPDSNHLVYAAISEEDELYVVFDGKEEIVSEYREIGQFTFSPDSRHLAYVADQGGYSRVVLDGKEGRLYDMMFEPPVFSPDSKHLAYGGGKQKKEFIVIDGQEGNAYYEDVSHPVFSPDSKEVTYVARKGDKKFVVIRSREGQPYDWVWAPIFSSNGKYVGYGAKKGNELWWIIDDVESYTEE